MRGGVPYILKFISKFCLEIAPAALATVIGAVLFAQYHAQPTPTPAPLAAEVSAVAPEHLAAMVQEEHALLVDYLKRERPLAKASDDQQPAVAPAKPRSAVRESPGKMRKPPLAADDARMTGAAAPALRTAETRPALVLADARDAAAERTEKPKLGGEPPVAQRREGFLGSMLNRAVRIKDRAVELSHVRDAIGFVRDMPGRLLPGSARPSDSPAPTPAGRFTQASW